MLATAFNVVGTVCMLISLLLPANKIKTILFFNFLSGVIIATGYLFADGAINGAISCYAGGVMALINFGFQVKAKPIPKWLQVLYALVFVGLNLLGGFSYLYVIAVLATMLFVLSIGQTNGALYRRWTLLNVILWCVYDVLSRSYASLIPHGTLVVFTLAGMYINDRKK